MLFKDVFMAGIVSVRCRDAQAEDGRKVSGGEKAASARYQS